MKKVPMILLMIVPYAALIICYQANMDLRIGACVYGVLLLFNMIYAFLLPGFGFNGQKILFWNLLLKLCNIPLVALIRLFTLVMLMAGGTRLQNESFSLVWIAMLMLFLVRLSSAMFGISGFRWCRTYGTLSKTGMIASSVVQVIPFADVIGSILCYIMFRNEGKTSE